MAEPKRIKLGKTQDVFRPMVIGDEHFAYRLQVYLLGSEELSVIDPMSYIENTWRPNLLIVFGPCGEQLLERVKLILKDDKDCKLIYACSTFSEQEREFATETSKTLNADCSIIKDFVTVEDIGAAIIRISNA